MFNMQGIRRFAEQSPAERHGIPDGFKGIGRELLWHKSNEGACLPVLRHRVVTIDADMAAARIREATDDADQACFARTIGA